MVSYEAPMVRRHRYGTWDFVRTYPPQAAAVTVTEQSIAYTLMDPLSVELIKSPFSFDMRGGMLSNEP